MKRVRHVRYAYPLLGKKTWQSELLRWSKDHGWPVEEVLEVRPVSKDYVQLKVRIGWREQEAAS